jgi:hypothetical protein
MTAPRGWRAAMLAGVLVLCASGGAWAYDGIVGDWIVHTERDRFSGGERVIGARVGEIGVLMVRCLNEQRSIAVKAFTAPFGQSDELFPIKFKVDDHEAMVSLAEPLDSSTVEILVRPGMLEQIADGQELALRFETARVRFDQTYQIGKGAARVVAMVAKACAESAN